ncbi:hypothetical protein E2562_024057 [Oryza meyeriana var. granulata]|uniref:Uncharacterized protein n=1 Tax=Oryza meyeriana var. granulata TaxID=110450 RepID=A0A6G1CSC0_9ORYZ|nr:hypothetical protein E2562_024057 [Oryza meyeriana var. granulata]
MARKGAHQRGAHRCGREIEAGDSVQAPGDCKSRGKSRPAAWRFAKQDQGRRTSTLGSGNGETEARTGRLTDESTASAVR